MDLTKESVQGEILRTRHKAEVPIYIICIVLGALYGIYLIIGLLLGASYDNFFIALLIIGAICFILVIGGLLFLFIVALYFVYGGQLATSIRVSQKNFPEIYEKVKQYSELLGLRKEPEVYVRQMNGTINAHTYWLPGRVIIQLNAEIVDLAYMENKDFDTVYFVMAHEFGHSYLHHIQLQYRIWTIFAALIPVIGSIVLLPMLSRAREYSCDRVAQALTNNTNDVETMMMLMAGRHAYKYLDVNEYLEKINEENSVMGSFTKWFINLILSHPIMPLRVKALADPEKKSGKLV